MTKLVLYNSLSKKKESFVAIDPLNIKIYSCGPTVYNHIHIGNARPLIVFDILIKVLKHLYGQNNIIYVRNITDIDDKIIAKAKEENTTWQDIANFYNNEFQTVCQKLGLENPKFQPKATDHINDMLNIITQLKNKGFAYSNNFGDVLFNVEQYKDYGKLSGRNYKDNIENTRDLVNTKKNNPNDFVLWKAEKDSENINGKTVSWQSPFGNGRPGWHIECSAMAYKHLGESFDIHLGGMDLIFPHHENEIAQTCCAFGVKNMANYWLHNGLITINDVKMSKSLGNVLLVKDLLEQYSESVIKFAVLCTHYRQNFNLTNEILEQSKKALDKFSEILDIFDNTINDGSVLPDFLTALLDDLNTPKAVSVLHLNFNNIIKNKNSYLAMQFVNSLNLLGTGLHKTINNKNNTTVNEEKIVNLINLRITAKIEKNYQLADEIRKQLLEMGVEIKDTKNGEVEWKIVQ